MPTYLWQKNGAEIFGETGASYSATSLVNGDVISVVMTSNAGCASGSPATSNTIAMTVVEYPVATISYNATPYCATGKALVTQTGQTGGTYSSSTGLAIDAATGEVDLAASTPGTYIVTYNFTNGTCNSNTTTGIVINPLPVINTSVTPVSCFASSTGAVNLTVTGVMVQSYSWTGPSSFSASTEDVSNVPAGTYTVVVTSTNGCTASTSVIVTEPTALTNSFVSKVNNACNGGSEGQIKVAASGGTPAYTYSIVSGPTVNTSGATTGIFTGLAAGTYTIQVTDANGCIATVNNIIVTEPTATKADGTISVADFTDNFFPNSTSEITILYQVNEISGNPALNALLRVTKQAGYTFSLPAISSLTIGAGANAITYPVDNSRWTADNSDPIFFRASMNSGQQIGCGQSVYLAIKLTRSTPSKSVFVLTTQLRNITGETNTANNSTVFLLVSQ